MKSENSVLKSIISQIYRIYICEIFQSINNYGTISKNHPLDSDGIKKIQIKPKPPEQLKKETKKRKKKHETLSPFTPKKKSNFVTVKTSLKSVLKNYNHNLPLINQLVYDCHEITVRTYYFMRLYILHKYSKIDMSKETLIPPLDRDYIMSFVRAIGTHDPKGRKPEETEFARELDEFYHLEFEPCINLAKVNLVRKTDILCYMATQIQTSYNNNIKEHFIERIRTIMNCLKPEQLTDKKLFSQIKNLILLDRHDLIPEQYQPWSNMIKKEYLPPLYDKCYGYDVKVYPEKYLWYTIKISHAIEQINLTVQHSQLSDEEKKQQIKKLFQSIPLRTSKIPCYITLDATAIMTNFFEHGKAQLRKNISSHQKEIWGSLFNIDQPVMKMKGYHFESLQTDGVGVSICFQKDGLTKAEKNRKLQTYDPMHIDELSENDLSHCLNKKLVSGDPGKGALQMLDKHGKKLRYSTRQRRSESRREIGQRIMNSEKEYYNVSREEAKLSEYNGKTVDYQSFKEYIRIEMEFNQRTQSFYHMDIWRKMKWRTWINLRRSEDQFLNRISQVYGSPEEILICYGDWSQSKQMKYLLPSQGVGLRRLISKKYHLVLINEFRTSMLCSHCHHELDHKIGNHSDGLVTKELYRVLVCHHCQNDRSESICRFFNRDINACINMLYLADEWLEKRSRPVEYKREMILTTHVENLGSL